MTKEAVSFISILANFFLGVLKIGLGVLAKSSALVADGFHSGMDVFSSLIAFWGIKVAQRKPTKVHSYGWARVEVLAGFVLPFFLL